MSVQVVDLSNPLWLQTLQKLRHDIYHLPEYLALEAARVAAIPEAILIVDDEKIYFVPYLLRQCSAIFDEVQVTEKVFDVVSPYGYPGILLSEAAASTPKFIDYAMNEMIYMLREKQVCSAFLRLHPMLNHGFSKICKPEIYRVTGETVSVNLKLSETEIWHQTRSEHRNKINRCKRAGFIARIVPFKQYINDFNVIYEDTMVRVEATNLYYFSYEYFLHLSDALGEKIHLCIVEFNKQVTCAGLFTECCGIVQYHLGGTRTEFLKQSPSKLMFDYVRLWAKDRGNEVFHLGGGVGSSKDSLYHFKAGFSKQRQDFLTLHMIVNKDKYLQLVNLHAKFLSIETEKLLKTDFFPAYRYLV